MNDMVKPNVPVGKKRPIEIIDLSEDDERILDEIWVKIRQEGVDATLPTPGADDEMDIQSS